MSIAKELYSKSFKLLPWASALPRGVGGCGLGLEAVGFRLIFASEAHFSTGWDSSRPF